MPTRIALLFGRPSLRSRIAEAVARALAPENVHVEAAFASGSPNHPRGSAGAATDALPQDSGRPYQGLAFESLDLVVSIGADAAAACPALPKRLDHVHWPIEEPKVPAKESEGSSAAASDLERELRHRFEGLFLVVRGDPKLPVLSVERVYEGPRVVKVDRERLRLPNGTETTLEIIHHPGASAVVPLHRDHTITMIRQYRHAAGGYILEVPAGKLDPGETPESCALRECREEAGLHPGRLHRLGPILTTPGFTDEIIHLFAATRLEVVPQALEGDEVIEVLRVPLANALRMIASAEIRDSKTICALFRTEQELAAGRLETD